MSRSNHNHKVLLIDDDVHLTKILSIKLAESSCDIDVAHTAREGIELASKGLYSAIVLDLGLPDKTGFSVCQTLRNKGISTPIIFLTGDVQPKHLVHGLRIGADDYLTKPFRSSELIARVNALVRRHERSYIVRQLTAQGFVLDLENATLTSGVTSKSSKLTQTESKILATLLKQSPEIVSRNHLFQEVWGINDAHTSNRLDVYIRRLRKKMQTIHYEAHIHTTFKGYQFK